MAVTLVSAPDQFALTKGGRMLYQFSGSGRLQTTGVVAIAVLFISAAVTDGTSITLRWNGQNYPIVFKTSPAAANEFAAGNGNSAYVDALLTQLQGYYPLREDFHITRYDPTQLPGIVLTAKQPGAAYTLSLLNPPVGSPFTVGNTASGADALLRNQYSIYTELWVQRIGTSGNDLTSDYDRVYTAPIETDTNGNAQIDVGNILHSNLLPDWPTWSVAGPSSSPASHRKYFLAYGEAWGFPLQVARIFTDQVRHAYLGGADYRNRSSSGYLLSRFSAVDATNKALRFGSQTRYVLPDEPQFLTFLNQTSAALTPLLLRVSLTFNDDTTSVVDDVYSAQTLAVGAKITFPVGATALNLAAHVDSGKTLKEYSVKVLLNGADWSVPYRYVLNATYQPYTRFFGYLSSLGVVETLTTYGKGSSELEIFSDQAERYLPAHYEVADGQFVNYNTSVQQQVTVATGFWPQAVLQTWNDFYRSPYRFRLQDGLALPVGIISKSIKQAKDGDTLFAHSFDYNYLYKDDFYTGAEVDEIGDGATPLNFKPMGGTVVITTPVVTRNVDDTVPNVVRNISQDDITAWNTAAAQPNPQTLGFLTQDSGNALYRTKADPIHYTDITDTPTTRDGYGLTDVPTRADLFKLIHIKPLVSSWTGDSVPAEPQ